MTDTPESVLTAGQTVYSPDGRTGVYVASVDDGVIVQPLIDSGSPDEAPYPAGVELWPEAYTEPPRAVLEQSIAALRAEERALRESIQSMHRERHEASRDQADVMGRLKQHAALQHLDAMLNGGITHYVVQDDGWKILTAAEFGASKHMSYWRPMLVLSATRDKPARWNVCHDGKAAADVVPCASLDEAQGVRRECLLKDLREVTRGGNWSLWNVPDPLRRCAEAGIESPADIREAVAKAERAQAVDTLEKARAAYQAAVDALEALTGAEASACA